MIPQATAGRRVTAFVGGEIAAGVDTSAYLSGRLPWVIGVVVLAHGRRAIPAIPAAGGAAVVGPDPGSTVGAIKAPDNRDETPRA